MTVNIVNVDASMAVTSGVYSNKCRFGDEDCNIEVTDDSRILVTLPNNYNRSGKNNIETYDMRSIIESIQELSRRTATFNCNVSFLSAMETFDVSPTPNNMFACDTHRDGLPAAQLGEIDTETANGLYKVPLVATNHGNEHIYTLGEENATNSITIGLDNTEIKNLYDALLKFLYIPPQFELDRSVIVSMIYTDGSKVIDMSDKIVTRVLIGDNEHQITFIVIENDGIYARMAGANLAIRVYKDDYIKIANRYIINNTGDDVLYITSINGSMLTNKLWNYTTGTYMDLKNNTFDISEITKDDISVHKSACIPINPTRTTNSTSIMNILLIGIIPYGIIRSLLLIIKTRLMER